MLTDEAGKDLVDVCQDAAAKCFYDRYKIMKKVLVNEMQCPKFVMQSVSTFEKRANVQPEESAPITSLTERWAVETPRHKTTMGNMSAIQALVKRWPRRLLAKAFVRLQEASDRHPRRSDGDFESVPTHGHQNRYC